MTPVIQIAQAAADPLGVLWGMLKANPWLFVIVAVIGALGIVIPDAKRRSRRRNALRSTTGAAPAEPPIGAFEAQHGLLTQTEANLHRTLSRILRTDQPDSPRILAKVRLADIASPPRDSPTWQADFNRVQSKHVDFVVVAGDRMLPLRVIELDDASHARPDRIVRDETVDHVLTSAGIPILHVPVAKMNDETWLRRQLGLLSRDRSK